jgi:hypothetical protein
MRPNDEDGMRFESLLVAERPEPRLEFAAELDARVAEGFAKQRQPKRRAFQLRYALGAASVVAATAVAVSVSGVLEDERPAGRDVRELPGVADQNEHAHPEAGRQSDETSAAGAVVEPFSKRVPAEPAKRRQARTADLILSTASADVRDVADGVVDVTHRYRGFVLRSNVSSGNGSNAGGEFELKLPARDLQPALDDLSELAHVSSLEEGTEDIARRFTSARGRIDQLTEQRERLRAKLAEADTIEQESALRLRLHEVRRSLEAVRADLARATERVRFVPVHIGIRADADEAPVDTGWSIGDALDDAVRVLEVAVGVTLIALAASLPVAIVSALLWLAARAWVRSRRERALDERAG